jgi:hypothetical protein
MVVSRSKTKMLTCAECVPYTLQALFFSLFPLLKVGMTDFTSPRGFRQAPGGLLQKNSDHHYYNGGRLTEKALKIAGLKERKMKLDSFCS